MGNILKVGVSWTPQGIDKTLKTKFSVGVGGLPTRIAVTKLPNKIDYVDGQTINPSGIIVHAYYADGTDYGTVLNSELTFEPMSADATKAESGYTSDLDTGVVAKPIPTSNAIQFLYDETHVLYGHMRSRTRIEPVEGSVLVFGFPRYDWFYCFACSKNPLPSAKVVTINYITGEITTEIKDRRTSSDPCRNQAMVDGKAVYWTEIFSNYGNTYYTIEEGTAIRYDPPLDSSDVDAHFGANAAYTILYGNAEGGGQPITVKWNRPADKEVLTTTFNVNVSGGS